jgi:hypothetical protein
MQFVSVKGWAIGSQLARMFRILNSLQRDFVAAPQHAKIVARMDTRFKKEGEKL